MKCNAHTSRLGTNDKPGLSGQGDPFKADAAVFTIIGGQDRCEALRRGLSLVFKTYGGVAGL